MSQEELAYYRAVEDAFCRLRGTPFLFSPKDFAYLRRWWQQGIPLAAVLLGLGEVFARRRERGQDPVSSLAYCRHAVARQAKRLAQAQVGAEAVALDLGRALDALVAAVREAEAAAPSPPLREVLARCRASLETLPRDVPAALVAENLAQVEEQTLTQALQVLPPEERGRLEEALRAQAPPGEALSGRALEVALLRAVREYLGLPRLELAADGA